MQPQELEFESWLPDTGDKFKFSFHFRLEPEWAIHISHSAIFPLLHYDSAAFFDEDNLIRHTDTVAGGDAPPLLGPLSAGDRRPVRMITRKPRTCYAIKLTVLDESGKRLPDTQGWAGKESLLVRFTIKTRLPIPPESEPNGWFDKYFEEWE